MKKLTIKTAFLLTTTEIAFLNGLPVNGPTAKLTTIDTRQLSNIYYRIFGADASPVNIAMRQKWPGGERVKTTEAQRLVLSALTALQANIEATAPIDQLGLLLATMSVGTELHVYLCGRVLETEYFDDTANIRTNVTDRVGIVINGTPMLVQGGADIPYNALVGMVGLPEGSKAVLRPHYYEDNQPSLEVTPATGYPTPHEGDVLWITASTPVPDAVSQEGDGPTTHGANA